MLDFFAMLCFCFCYAMGWDGMGVYVHAVLPAYERAWDIRGAASLEDVDLSICTDGWT